MKKQISELRESYIQQVLRRSDLKEDVFAQFMSWFDEAVDAKMPEPNAMTLATVNQSRLPSTRIVLFKGLTSRSGISFFTNYNSRKGKEIQVNPFAALSFCWIPMARQIRIEGRVVKMPREESEAYFNSRPRGSQIGAWVSQQSAIIKSRDVLEMEQQRLIEKYANSESIPTPPHWGGYELIPNRFEFWQGNENRLHDRFVYEKRDSDWVVERLAP